MPRTKRSARGHARPNPTGVLQVAAGGYGFVDTPEGEYFVPASKMGGAFDGDTVEVKPVSVNRDRPQPGKEHNAVGKKPTARVVGVVSRAHATVVGRYEVAEPFGVVVPEDSRIQHDIFTMHAENPGVRDGDLVRVRIVQYPARNAAATGVVEQVLGRAEAPGLGIDAIVAAHNLRVEFPPEALADAGEARVDAARALREGYADLRERVAFTIDPPDARDFDDALSLEREGDGWRLGVHIADVSWYVKPGSAVDAEARLRATSVYLADRMLPMLPEALCNGACSLAPGQERRCMTVDVLLDAAGEVRDVSFYPAVIRSDARLDYGQVQELLDGGRAVVSGSIPDEVAWRLVELDALAQRFKEARRRAGALDLESPEAHVLLDADGTPLEVALRRSIRATELVEQCMVLANALVARFLLDAGEPAIYRVHAAPDPVALAGLVPLLQELDLGARVDLEAFAAGSTRAIQQVLAESRGREEAELVSMLVLRAMKRAAYAAECEQHYGLALDEYLHFTSPIRRYPDLVAHRALKRALGLPAGGAVPEGLATLAEHCSAMERAADEAAFQSQELKLVEYLSRFVGQAFDAVVSKVATYGFFVRLDNTASGLVAAGSLGEPFSLDVRRQLLTGQDTGRTLRLGQRVRVVLVAARISSRELDFELA